MHSVVEQLTQPMRFNINDRQFEADAGATVRATIQERSLVVEAG
jgi:hypothetical protein